MKLYYYAINGQSLGPVPLDTLHLMAERGNITPDTQVIEEGTESWVSYAYLPRPITPSKTKRASKKQKLKQPFLASVLNVIGLLTLISAAIGVLFALFGAYIADDVDSIYLLANALGAGLSGALFIALGNFVTKQANK